MDTLYKMKKEDKENKGNHTNHKDSSIKRVRECNRNVKITMAKELSSQGLPEEAIMRILHISTTCDNEK